MYTLYLSFYMQTVVVNYVCSKMYNILQWPWHYIGHQPWWQHNDYSNMFYSWIITARCSSHVHSYSQLLRPSFTISQWIQHGAKLTKRKTNRCCGQQFIKNIMWFRSLFALGNSFDFVWSMKIVCFWSVCYQRFHCSATTLNTFIISQHWLYTMSTVCKFQTVCGA